MQNKTTFVHKEMKGGRKTLGEGREEEEGKKELSVLFLFLLFFFLPRYRFNVRKEGKKRRGNVVSEKKKNLFFC